jgi:hypothetical protein
LFQAVLAPVKKKAIASSHWMSTILYLLNIGKIQCGGRNARVRMKILLSVKFLLCVRIITSSIPTRTYIAYILHERNQLACSPLEATFQHRIYLRFILEPPTRNCGLLLQT